MAFTNVQSDQVLCTNEEGVVEKCPIMTDHLLQQQINVHNYLRNVNTKNVLETTILMSGPCKRREATSAQMCGIKKDIITLHSKIGRSRK
jgi:hypothetical protein